MPLAGLASSSTSNSLRHTALGIRFARPVTSAGDTTLAKPAYWGIRGTDRELAERFIQAVWHRHFREGLAIGTAPDLAQAFAQAPAQAFANGALDAEAIASAAQAPKARQDQGACNAQAVTLGCFGIPWVVVDGQSFFGQDRLDQVAARLGVGQVGQAGGLPAAAVPAAE